MELRRNEKTGLVEAWKDGKKIGEVLTQGDLTSKKKSTVKKFSDLIEVPKERGLTE